ncbi:hypothetical protein AB4099_05295 [Bosea sp. 2KB_26]|uniref:hypothetical protein n=1 Tax=Bosea sp. 2KB_26 TaxID=3237475 RepID=UPI003F8FD828
MSRRPGEITSKQVLRAYPYQVQILIPERGLGNALSRMLAWCRQRSYNERTVPGFDAGWCYVRFCFETIRQADEFAMDFGGERIDRVARLRAFSTQLALQPDFKPEFASQFRILPARVEEPADL